MTVARNVPMTLTAPYVLYTADGIELVTRHDIQVDVAERPQGQRRVLPDQSPGQPKVTAEEKAAEKTRRVLASAPARLKPLEFCYWLQGFAGLNGGEVPDQDQWNAICAHLVVALKRPAKGLGYP